MKKTHVLVFSLLCMVMIGCSKYQGMMQELFAVLYELMDNLAKVTDDETAKKFLDGDGKKLEDRVKEMEKRHEEFIRNADKDEKKDVIEILKSEMVINEMESAARMLAHQGKRLAALEARMKAEGRKTENLSKLTGSGYVKGFLGKNAQMEKTFSKY